ncbi:MAG: hypothetical protein J0L51_00875 [Rhizobiales bacterium]|nr:hypothetical protein [Hyphomicrobiales bacterium]
MAVAGLLFAAANANAAEKLNGDAIKELFTGNTVAGTYMHGGLFSEFHAIDGRALGDNGFTLNVDACWNIDGDAVCYHYGPRTDRRTYCFTVEKEGENYRLLVRDTGRPNAIARILKGNANEHGDGGKRWSCDDLLAGAPAIRSFAFR